MAGGKQQVAIKSGGRLHYLEQTEISRTTGTIKVPLRPGGQSRGIDSLNQSKSPISSLQTCNFVPLMLLNLDKKVY